MHDNDLLRATVAERGSFSISSRYDRQVVLILAASATTWDGSAAAFDLYYDRHSRPVNAYE